MDRYWILVTKRKEVLGWRMTLIKVTGARMKMVQIERPREVHLDLKDLEDFGSEQWCLTR